MWELDYKESWAPKNWCFWTVVLKTLESPLDCKEIQPVHPKGDQSWVFVGRTDAEAETPILWPPHAKSWLIGKDPDAGRHWAGGEGDNRGWDGWMASPTQWTWVWVNSQSWWWTGRLACCNSWGCKESETTEWLNWTELPGFSEQCKQCEQQDNRRHQQAIPPSFFVCRKNVPRGRFKISNLDLKNDERGLKYYRNLKLVEIFRIQNTIRVSRRIRMQVNSCISVFLYVCMYMYISVFLYILLYSCNILI